MEHIMKTKHIIAIAAIATVTALALVYGKQKLAKLTGKLAEAATNAHEAE